VDPQIIKDFENKLGIFQDSFTGISSDFLDKLETLAVQIKDISESVQFLKRMKQIYEEQNKKIETMETTINELMIRLDEIVEGGTPKKKRKKK